MFAYQLRKKKQNKSTEGHCWSNAKMCTLSQKLELCPRSFFPASIPSELQTLHGKKMKIQLTLKFCCEVEKTEHTVRDLFSCCRDPNPEAKETRRFLRSLPEDSESGETCCF